MPGSIIRSSSSVNVSPRSRTAAVSWSTPMALARLGALVCVADDCGAALMLAALSTATICCIQTLRSILGYGVTVSKAGRQTNFGLIADVIDRLPDGDRKPANTCQGFCRAEPARRDCEIVRGRNHKQGSRRENSNVEPGGGAALRLPGRGGHREAGQHSRACGSHKRDARNSRPNQEGREHRAL